MILFRVEASPRTGYGHLVRSSCLAAHLRSRVQPVFVVPDDKAAARWLQDRRFTQLRQGEALPALARSCRGIVFDLRHFQENDLALLDEARRRGLPTVQITDLGLVRQRVDCLIDGSLHAAEMLESGPGLHTGPEYMILHQRFRHFNKISKKQRPRLRRVFLNLGGAVEYRPLRRVIDLLQRRQLLLKIAPGFRVSRANCKVLRRVYPGISFCGRRDSLARAYYEADLALIAPGVSAYEAAACGTPALYLSHHELQQQTAAAFSGLGAGISGPLLADLDGTVLAALLAGFDPEKRASMSAAGKSLVDGRGVERVLQVFEEMGLVPGRQA